MTLLFGLFLYACGGTQINDTGDTAGFDCDTQFVSSLNLNLTDESGQPLSDADISYTVDGVVGTFVSEISAGEYLVGGEESGYFEVEISASLPDENDPFCWYLGEGSFSVEVLANECHVIPQSLSPEMEWMVVCE